MTIQQRITGIISCCRGAVRESLHGDKMKRKQRELRSWAEGAASLHVLNQLDTTVDQFLQVHDQLVIALVSHASADAMDSRYLACSLCFIPLQRSQSWFFNHHDGYSW